jgi:hypothetical protein
VLEKLVDYGADEGAHAAEHSFPQVLLDKTVAAPALSHLRLSTAGGYVGGRQLLAAVVTFATARGSQALAWLTGSHASTGLFLLLPDCL